MRAILTYHSLDDSGSAISVPVARFRRQMAWLASQGVQVVSLDELHALPEPARAVALTFDDGIANVLTEAAPILETMGWPATVFAVTQRVGLENDWCGSSLHRVPVLPLLGWKELGSLTTRGWTIGSHSRYHAKLPDCSDTQLDEELQGAADDVESALGMRPRWFAYPYGALDDRVAIRAAATYAGACTTDLRPLGTQEDPVRLPRIDAWYLKGPLRRAGWGTPAFRTILHCRRGIRTLREVLP